MPSMLVFGARNLGRVLAREFAADGWRVTAVSRTEETIHLLNDEVPEAVGMVADAEKADDVERVFREVGDVDLIVNAITTTPAFGGPIHEAPADALGPYVWKLLPAIFNVLRIGGAVLVQRGRGTLVQITGARPGAATPVAARGPLRRSRRGHSFNPRRGSSGR